MWAVTPKPCMRALVVHVTGLMFADPTVLTTRSQGHGVVAQYIRQYWSAIVICFAMIIVSVLFGLLAQLACVTRRNSLPRERTNTAQCTNSQQDAQSIRMEFATHVNT